eukprot:359488-Pelagomonas_calceolata.AAC.1
MQRAVIPHEWKTAKITSLYKKGSITDAGNYRMLAVSGTFYRLYANDVHTLLQDWCPKNNKVYDSIPCDKLWRHLHQCQLPNHLLSILKILYHNDNYILVDGDSKHMSGPPRVLNRAVTFLCCFSPLTLMTSMRFLRGLKELALARLISMDPTFYTLMTYA